MADNTETGDETSVTPAQSPFPLAVIVNGKRDTQLL